MSSKLKQKNCLPKFVFMCFFKVLNHIGFQIKTDEDILLLFGSCAVLHVFLLISLKSLKGPDLGSVIQFVNDQPIPHSSNPIVVTDLSVYEIIGAQFSC